MAVESTGIFASRTSDRGGYGDHIKAGARKVVLSAPAKDDPDLMVVMARTPDNRITAFIVEAHWEGVEVAHGSRTRSR